jgi:hypothetical protein
VLAGATLPKEAKEITQKTEPSGYAEDEEDAAIAALREGWNRR